MEEIDIPNEIFDELTNNLTIHSYLPTLQRLNLNIIDKSNSMFEDISGNNSSKIMINYLEIEENFYIYFLILNNKKAIIIDQIILQQNKNFFDEKLELFSFINEDCEEKFYVNITDSKEINGDEKYAKIKLHISKFRKQLKSFIINSLVKNSQIKTILRRQKNKMKCITSKNEYKMNDFVILKSFSKSVFLVYNINDQFLYVLKTFDKSLSETETLYKREVSVYQKLENQNPFICTFYGNFETIKTYCIVIEYIEGKTLHDFILKKKNNISEFDKYKIILEIILSVEYIHYRNYVLRDLKWNNIIIDSNNDAILIDFDLARHKKTSKEEIVTNDVGIKYFAAPEQYCKGEFSVKSDIYSIGMLIHFILSELNYERIMTNQFISRIYDKKQNILTTKEFLNIPTQFEFLIKNYQQCLNFAPETRPSIPIFYTNILMAIINKHGLDSLTELFYVFDTRTKLVRLIIGISDQVLSNNFTKKIINGQVSDNDLNKFYEFLEENKDGLDTWSNLIYGYMSLTQMNSKADRNKGIKAIEKLSNSKSPLIQTLLGGLYYNDDKFMLNDIEKSIDHLKQGADQNNPDAQYFLGSIYYNGQYVQKDINKAFHYLYLSANQNNHFAQYFMGLIYFEGIYVEKNINKAIDYFFKSANQNDELAQVALGKIFYDGDNGIKDIQKAIYYFKLAANKNDSEAQYILGMIYTCDPNVQRDIPKSITYLTLSANQNNVLAQFLLGKIYLNEKLGFINVDKAIYYLTLAAKQSHAEAITCLGYVYWHEKYGFVDKNKSIYYFEQAAELGDEYALKILAGFYLYGTFVNQNINKSIKYLEILANKNNCTALKSLGYIYSNESFGLFDINKAIAYLSIAYKQGDIESSTILGEIYLDSKYGKQNITKSIKYFTFSANSGDSSAQFLLGKIYFEGLYVPKDIDKSIYYLKLSANQNISSAQALLGLIYSRSNEHLSDSIYYLTLACQNNNDEAPLYLAAMYYKGNKIARNINKSIYYMNLAAQRNNNVAQYFMGVLYLYGIYIKQDIKKSIDYLKLSANQNNFLAQYKLGVLYYENFYVPRDINKSIFYLTLAAENKYKNNSKIYFYLGAVYYCDQYIPKDIEKAIHYFKESSCFNNHRAKNNLGVIYKNGEGVKKNINQAIEYFEEAIKYKNDSYSRFNLAKIFYFGTDVNRNIAKSIELLENVSDENNLPAYLLLFYIYFLSDDENIKNIQKAEYYFNLIMDLCFDIDFYMLIFNIYYHNYDNNNIAIIRFIEFIKEYDLIYLIDSDSDLFESDFICFLNTGSFHQPEKNTQDMNTKNKRKNITEDFYRGFYND